MKGISCHAEWLSLIDVSGPFLAEPVLNQAFPQGLEQMDVLKRKTLRQAYDEWREAIDLEDPELPAIHTAWISLVLEQGLELNEDGNEDILKPHAKLNNTLNYKVPEHGIVLSPDFAVVNDQNNKTLLLIKIYSPEVQLDELVKGDGWATSPAERMVELCRALNIRLGLVTNGEQWMLIDAPVGSVTTFASWYARLWGPEPVTLQAFVNLLGIRRFFVDQGEQLPALFDDSLKYQEEVTDALGEQVRRAVEVLIQALDRADVDRNRELLEGVEPPELYEAGLTIMMRIVFLLSAEERGLLLMGDEHYEANYAVSTLRMQLRAESEEILERRWDAWSRLLAVFRAVYDGIEHEAMRLPALGGSLFDPDRFPFLEGRSKESHWKKDLAVPLPIDNRTVLLLLDAVQLFQGRTLSYRALDVEQIGHIYEGLLERTVVRASEVTLDLDATKNAKKPWVTLDELAVAANEGEKVIEALLKDRTGSSASRVKNDLAKKADEAAAEKLLTACYGDQILRDQIKPYFHFLRMDRWGYPLVYPEKTFMVTTGADRRVTGTHYTPKSLTETIIKETLELVVYVGPVDGNPREEWILKTPAELLDIKLCDPAMGSGAFLVQACRWLSERLVEAWELAEKQRKTVTSEGEVVDDIGSYEPLQTDTEERLLTARRLIAERCLYGVDMNPLAVELAKLSIWLVTLAKGRPFGFLNHNLRCGDSLLGLHNLEQLHYLDIKPGKDSSKKLFAQKIDQAIEKSINLRFELRSRPIRDIRDIELMASLDDEARRELKLSELLADALVGEVLAASGKNIDMTLLSVEAGSAIEGDIGKHKALVKRSRKGLGTDLSAGKSARRPFHWPLEFPEVFFGPKCGFDCFIGNPPFFAGAWLAGNVGMAYRGSLVNIIANGLTGLRGTADLCVYFLLRAACLINEQGVLGFVLSKAVAEGDSKEVGLDELLLRGLKIISAHSKAKWPGKANVDYVMITLAGAHYDGPARLDGIKVDSVNSSLTVQEEIPKPKALASNNKIICKGHELQGDGFKISKEIASEILSLRKESRDVIFPLITGDLVNNDPFLEPREYVINFRDMDIDSAKSHIEAFKIVESHVKPDRDKYTGSTQRDIFLRKYWWLFRGFRKELFEYSKNHENMVVFSVVSKHRIFVLCRSKWVPTASICCILADSVGLFGVLQSSIHNIWAENFGSSLGATMRYIAGRCFKTFPFPKREELARLKKASIEYIEFRKQIQERESLGLTDLFNQLHDENNRGDAMVGMREITAQLDNAVATAYGWSDISLNHGFHQVPYLTQNDRIRFTIAEHVRIEILRRLSALNREQLEAEQLRNKSTTRKSVKPHDPTPLVDIPNSCEASTQADLFEVDE